MKLPPILASADACLLDLLAASKMQSETGPNKRDQRKFVSASHQNKTTPSTAQPSTAQPGRAKPGGDTLERKELMLT